MVAKKKKNVVLFGLGNMGRNHFRVLEEDPRFNLVAVVDPKADSLPDTIKSNAKLLRSLEELGALEYDCAVVASPTETHFDVTSRLLDLDKNILVEKPCASTYSEAVKLKTKAQNQGLVLCVGNIERCNPAVSQLKKVMSSSIIGTPVHVSATRGGRFPHEVKEGNNVILDLAVHELDVLRMILGPLNILTSLCHSTSLDGVYDTAEVLIKSEENTSASVHVNWLTPQKIRLLRVTGSSGVCEIDYIKQSCSVFGRDILSKIPEDMTNYTTETDSSFDTITFKIERKEPLKVQLDEFYKALCGDDHTLCMGDQMAESVMLAEKCMELSQGGIVPSFVNSQRLSSQRI